MTTGTKTHKGRAVPLYGESQIVAQVAATDVLTITGASGQTGDYLVLRDLDNNEIMSISSSGDINLEKHADHSSFAKLNLALLSTFPTTATGLTTGDLWMTKVTTDVYALTLCVSGAGNSVLRCRRAVIDVTLGSSS